MTRYIWSFGNENTNLSTIYFFRSRSKGSDAKFEEKNAESTKMKERNFTTQVFTISKHANIALKDFLSSFSFVGYVSLEKNLRGKS